MMSAFADTILVGADVVTLDATMPRAQAVAVRGGRIVAVGEEHVVLEHRSARTQVVDLGGRTITPGLIDAHMHPALGVTRAVGVDFTGVIEPEPALALLRTETDRTAEEAGDGWVRAQNLDYTLFQRLPMTADAIDGATGGRPALLFLFDGHTALVSSAALRLADITGEETFADASRIMVDGDGRPTGELRGESAIDRVFSVIPVPPLSEQATRVHGILDRLAGAGFTGACVMDGTTDTLDLLDEADSTGGGLALRLVTAIDHPPGSDDEAFHARVGLRDRRGARWRGGLVKLYADGVIDTGSGWLYEPDSLGGGSTPFWNDQDAFRNAVRAYHDAGFQIATHAIGDHAIGATIDAYPAASSSEPQRTPHRIEHLECMADRDLGRMAAAGITASVQPLHMQWRRPDGSDDWSTRLGAVRARRGWRVRDMIDAGMPVALGSDWPVAQFDARIGMAWARLRRTPGLPDAHVFEPDQVLTPLEALAGFTRWAARAQGDADAGIIRPGARADLTVWEENPLLVGADRLPAVPIHATILEGRTTYRSADATIATARDVAP